MQLLPVRAGTSGSGFEPQEEPLLDGPGFAEPRLLTA